MRTPPLLADFIHSRACKPICAKSLTLPCFKTGRPFQILPGRAEPEREVRPSGRGAGGPSMSADGDACPPRGGKHPFYLVCAFRVPFVKITGQPHNETAPTNLNFYTFTIASISST